VRKVQTRVSTALTTTSTWRTVRVGPVRLCSHTATSVTVLQVLVVVGAVLTLVWTFLTGEAGSRAVWGT